MKIFGGRRIPSLTKPTSLLSHAGVEELIFGNDNFSPIFFLIEAQAVGAHGCLPIAHVDVAQATDEAFPTTKAGVTDHGVAEIDCSVLVASVFILSGRSELLSALFLVFLSEQENNRSK